VGYLKPTPGTYASFLAAAAGWFVLDGAGWEALAALAALATALGLWAARHVEVDFGEHDPRPFVLDEVAGQWVALLGLAFFGDGARGWHLAAAFVLFRLFDILKPWPVRFFDRRRTAWGVVADDLAAGACVAALLALWAVLG